MSAVLANILIGLVTSVLSAGSVWTWQRARRISVLRRRTAFFGLDPGRTCLIVMNNHWQKPGSTSHNDVQTMIEIAALAYEAGCPISVLPVDDLHESNGDRTEFCIGGPGSNSRATTYLASYLPGVEWRPFDKKPGSGTIIVAGRRYPFEHGRTEHALVAKFTPPQSSSPVILISGQRSIDNRAAINLLKRSYQNLSKTIASLDRFCLIVRINSSDSYGYQAAEIVADATAAAFAPEIARPVEIGEPAQGSGSVGE